MEEELTFKEYQEKVYGELVDEFGQDRVDAWAERHRVSSLPSDDIIEIAKEAYGWTDEGLKQAFESDDDGTGFKIGHLAVGLDWDKEETR